MDSYIVQLAFSAALDRMSHSGLLIKLNSKLVFEDQVRGIVFRDS